jgi:predicted RNA-binding Zn-ribbon protein involved in translation (DUF1610 family)
MNMKDTVTGTDDDEDKTFILICTTCGQHHRVQPEELDPICPNCEGEVWR